MAPTARTSAEQEQVVPLLVMVFCALSLLAIAICCVMHATSQNIKRIKDRQRQYELYPVHLNGRMDLDAFRRQTGFGTLHEELVWRRSGGYGTFALE